MTFVLVVDDEPAILRTLRINLKARGYEVETAADGRSALQIARERTMIAALRADPSAPPAPAAAGSGAGDRDEEREE